MVNVQSLLLAGHFLFNLEFLERTHFFLNTLYFKTSKSSNGDAAGIQGGRYQNEGIASIWFKPQFGIFCPGIT